MLLRFPPTNFVSVFATQFGMYPWAFDLKRSVQIMTPKQRDREKIARSQVLAAAFRPDRVSIFSAVIHMAHVHKVCGL